MIEKFKLLKSETQPLTLELAQHFRDLEPSPTERGLSKSRIKYLTEKAKNGLFVTPSWATAQLGNRLLRVNGQHSSNVLCDLNGSFPEGLQVHIDHYQVDNEEAATLLFRQFDDPKSSRTSQEVAEVCQSIHPALRNLPKPIGKLGIDGIAWWKRSVEGLPVVSGPGVYDEFLDTANHPFLLWLGDIFTAKTPELRRPSIIAALYETFMINETEAIAFWPKVARGGEEYREDHPTTILDNWLLKKLKETTGEMKPAHFYQGCIFVWSAFRTDKPITSIKWDTKKGLLRAAE